MNEDIKAMKACESCGRAEIGKNHNKQPVWKRAIGLVFVYLPIFTLPFVFFKCLSDLLPFNISGWKKHKKIF